MKRILFVDDEPELLDSLERLLHPMKGRWEMVFARSGCEALACLELQPFDVLVTDVRMPQLDGVRLLRWAKAKYPGMTRIVLSGYFEREMALGAAEAANLYLVKPVDFTQLQAAIDGSDAKQECTP
jgi:YesN/AraC family two-component response regulator